MVPHPSCSQIETTRSIAKPLKKIGDRAVTYRVEALKLLPHGTDTS